MNRLAFFTVGAGFAFVLSGALPMHSRDLGIFGRWVLISGFVILFAAGGIA